PYAETQEVLAGYWIVDCESFDRATAIAARLSSCPAPAGASEPAADVRPIGRPVTHSSQARRSGPCLQPELLTQGATLLNIVQMPQSQLHVFTNQSSHLDQSYYTSPAQVWLQGFDDLLG